MSDRMEREKKELTTKEIEKEKMKNQLINMGIYDAGETYEQMKDLIGFLSNSETMPNVATDKSQKKDNEQHSVNECLLGLTSETDTSQELVVAQESPKVTCKPSHTLSTASVQQERKNSRHSSSPESLTLSMSPPIFETRGPVQARKGADNDAETTSPSEKQQQHEQSGASRSVPGTKPGNGTPECQNSSADTKPMQCAMQSTYYQRLERWRMNPLDVCINENDVPLQQPKSRLTAQNCAPSSSGYKKYTSEQHDQKMRALGQHLRELADLWYSWQRPANAKFEWGVPIEVGTANGSLDRKPVTEPNTEPSKAECAYRDNYERSSKRKANSLIAKECANLNKESSSDEDDQYQFVRVKKKKMQMPDDRLSNAMVDQRANQQQVRAGKQELTVTLVARQLHNDGDNDVHIDDKDVRSPRRRKTENEGDERLSPVLITHSKKLAVPSTPKARPSLSRLRRGSTTSRLFLKMQRTGENKETKQRNQTKKDNVMTDEEICHKLEEDSDGEEVAAILQKEVETQSSKETKFRLQERRLLSNNAEALRETTSVTCKERESDRQQRGNKEKADFGEQRKNEDKLYEVANKTSWEHHLLDDDDEMEQEPAATQNGNRRDKVTDPTNNISCPICNKPFPPDEIENHAADCDQFETHDDEDADDVEQFKCNICDNYKTTNGVDYQLHVKQCIDSRKNKKLLHGSDDVNVISISSSHRTYKSNKLKAASSSPEIGLMDQSPSHSRTRVFTNRKRKH